MAYLSHELWVTHPSQPGTNRVNGSR
ncbi:hypothetical protein LSH36_537g01020 [Paralvinella palmiformis]|uniref:Uncharacterized protein n=1 Tax=Paralvinella palmiformis TaxID=53620 RepID=A0AAD9MVX4_9ANNE|nr:hypothetical protein LSH36_537g01020 [Paralvinella palmiformis]